MARGPSTFRQRDLTAALRAARDAGVDMRVEVMKGKIVLIPIGKPPTADDSPDAGAWDDLK